MKTYIDNEDKMIELWFANGENPDSIIPNSISGVIDEYRKLKYQVCMFHSGTQEITPLTSALLISNLQELASKKSKQEQDYEMEFWKYIAQVFLLCYNEFSKL